MIFGAALLVLLGLALFVGGVLTGETAYYWACVATCLGAAVLLFVARRRLAAGADAPTAGAPGGRTELPSSAPAGGGAATAAAPGGTTTEPVRDSRPAAHDHREPHAAEDLPDPPVEEVEVTDLLLVVDLTDEVLVIDERPRYHLTGCVHLRGRTPIPLPIDEARSDGFTPCAVCAPDRHLAERVRARRAAG